MAILLSELFLLSCHSYIINVINCLLKIEWRHCFLHFLFLLPYDIVHYISPFFPNNPIVWHQVQEKKVHPRQLRAVLRVAQCMSLCAALVMLSYGGVSLHYLFKINFTSTIFAIFGTSVILFHFISCLTELRYTTLYSIILYCVLYYTMIHSAMLCYAMLYAMLCYAMLCYAMLLFTIPYYALVHRAMLCYTTLHYIMLYYTMLHHTTLYSIKSLRTLWDAHSVP